MKSTSFIFATLYILFSLSSIGASEQTSNENTNLARQEDAAKKGVLRVVKPPTLLATAIQHCEAIAVGIVLLFA